ncbi:MAG: pirin family protein [Myxococcota bacterium]
MSLRRVDLVMAAKEARLPDGAVVRRALPQIRRRLVGPFCFLDHMGPGAYSPERPVAVPPHAHVGLATVTWLFEGELEHRDSLGTRQRIVPGEVNWMSAGRGIVHEERSLPGAAGTLHGIQSWVAQPDRTREGPPAFAHHDGLPRWEAEGVGLVLVAGTLEGRASPVALEHPTLHAELCFEAASRIGLAVDPAFELALYVAEGEVEMQGASVPAGTLAISDPGAGPLELASAIGGRAVLVGGAPLGEPVVMFDNYVGRDPRALREAHEAFLRGELGRID